MNKDTTVVVKGADKPTLGCGIGPVATLAFFVFLGLKLSHIIDWSWWWVTCPLWLGAAIVIGIMVFAGGLVAVVAGVAFAFAALIDMYDGWRRRKLLKKRRKEGQR